MPYLIDTDWMVDRLAGLPDAVTLLDELAADGIAISIITYMELFQGVLQSDDPSTSESLLDGIVRAVPLVPVTQAVARRCAALRVDLKRKGKRVNSRALDLVIAASAIEYGLSLVTRNTRDYSDIDGLTLYQVLPDA